MRGQRYIHTSTLINCFCTLMLCAITGKASTIHNDVQGPQGALPDIRNLPLTPLDYLGDSVMQIDTEETVFHMESDLRYPGNIIFSDNHALKTTDFNSTTLILGPITDEQPTSEPISKKYHDLTGFVQLNARQVLAIAYSHHCLYWINRDNLTSTEFAGRCSESGFVDGVEEGRLLNPVSVIRNIHNLDQVIVTDTGNDALRLVDLQTKNISTLLRAPELSLRPRCPIFDMTNNETIYFSGGFQAAIFKFDIVTREVELFAGSINNRGHQDGVLSQTLLSAPRGIAQISDTVFAVAQHGSNDAVRLFDTNQGLMWSYCIGEILTNPGLEGNQCKVKDARAVLRVNNTLLVGGQKSIIQIPVVTPDTLDQMACNTSLTVKQSNEKITTLRMNKQDVIDLVSGEYIYVRESMCAVDIRVIDWKQRLAESIRTKDCSDKPIVQYHDIRQGGESITLELSPGRFLRTTAGFIKYTDSNCSQLLNVSTAPAPIEKPQKPKCPDPITKMASNLTGTAVVRVELPGISQMFVLPIGKHVYNISMENITCSIYIHVVDPGVRRRVYMEANYTPVNCTHLETNENRKLVAQMVEHHKAQIPEICDYDCSPATDMEPVLSCSGSTLTVSWPTDLVYGGGISEIPPLIAGRMEDSLRSKGLILSLVITSHRPPGVRKMDSIDVKYTAATVRTRIRIPNPWSELRSR